jgi:hypothetical protein
MQTWLNMLDAVKTQHLVQISSSISIRVSVSGKKPLS